MPSPALGAGPIPPAIAFPAIAIIPITKHASITIFFIINLLCYSYFLFAYKDIFILIIYGTSIKYKIYFIPLFLVDRRFIIKNGFYHNKKLYAKMKRR
jgi:hypothetical protein